MVSGWIQALREGKVSTGLLCLRLKNPLASDTQATQLEHERDSSQLRAQSLALVLIAPNMSSGPPPLELPPVVNVDGDAGFAFLPLLWLVNVWYFWPVLWQGKDEVIVKYTKRSLAGFLAATAVFLPWVITFAAGGPAVFGQSFFDEFNMGGSTFATEDIPL
ncbi:hypothetical protein WJX73_004230 [Symbiochloris irregularis]|uniref:Uncharacterized protein n=1 Tax=Symbiochloris irregularis TaxID=706552 RepID=A0AAW1PIR5_9CHLO